MLKAVFNTTTITLTPTVKIILLSSFILVVLVVGIIVGLNGNKGVVPVNTESHIENRIVVNNTSSSVVIYNGSRNNSKNKSVPPWVGH